MATKGTGAKDAIAVLRQDHRTIEGLFKEFERTGEKEKRRRKKLVKQAVEELSMHAQIEEQVFYPEVLGTAKEKELTHKAMEEHDLIKVLLEQLKTMTPEEERFSSKVAVLIDLVREHVREEERAMFPKIRKVLTRVQLQDLGVRLEEGKKAIQSPRDYLRLN